MNSPWIVRFSLYFNSVVFFTLGWLDVIYNGSHVSAALGTIIGGICFSIAHAMKVDK